ncbi:MULTISPECIES: hypothetical protein [unclassified Nocardioides]|uniref:hypothetical protein n=1 Tax=unclassified Nocardioides TaxID=2615069 RepID=UPI0009F02C53|nr:MULTISPECIES: hypothetical protein [unclassified Nocardioides]GAW50281.1 Putative uncharacterized protein [Nocardioides sp. PD653-B2]GAW53003.1 putative uncharacterized protein [Nocardioides sp. PD653]
MSITHGMDTVAGKQAGDQLRQGSDQIIEIAQRLDAILMSFDWTGTDADRVRAGWQDVERPALDVTAQHLSILAVQLQKEADEQDTASDRGSGAGAVASGAAAAPATGGGIIGWLDRHVGAFLDGLVSTVRNGRDFDGLLLDVLTGQQDWSVAALAASAISTVGAGVGAVVNGVTGEDAHWFEDGEGLAGTPVAAPTDPSRATQFQPVVTQPHDLPSLMQGVTDAYQVGSGPGSTGDIRITEVDNGTGTPSYIVAVPGTETWNPSAGANPHDLTSNLALVAGTPSAAAQSVVRAMEQAHIPPGSPVMLVGHSQAGIGIATLASDHSLVERFTITHVLTYGAPIDHIAIDPSVQVLQVQHGMDVVPRLDLGGVTTSGRFPASAPGVTLDSPGAVWRPDINHSYLEYSQSVRDELGAATDEGRILRDYQATLAPFFVTPGGSATAVDVPVTRGDRP